MTSAQRRNAKYDAIWAQARALGVLAPEPEKSRPEFYECGICSCYHPANWDGDCRDDANRFATDQLDAKYGALGWVLVDMPV